MITMMKDENYYKDCEDEANIRASDFRDRALRAANYRERKGWEEQASRYGQEALHNQRLADEAYEAKRLSRKHEFESQDEDDDEEKD